MGIMLAGRTSNTLDVSQSLVKHKKHDGFLRVFYNVFLLRRHRPVFRHWYWLHRQSWFRVRSLFYLGNRVFCPCCESRFRKFLSFGVNSRSNAVCPRCNSKGRHRLLWLYLKNKTNLSRENLVVLHFAPEYWFSQVLLSLPNLYYVTAGYQQYPRVMIRLDVTCIPLRNETFDVILCNHVLEHVPDDRQALQEMFRVLRPGGWAIIQVPVERNEAKTFEDANIILPADRERWFKQKDHVRLYGRDYLDRLKGAGFSVRVEYYGRELPEDLRRRCGVRRKHPIYLCTKPGNTPKSSDHWQATK